jgi:hypothetical protein
MDRIRAKAKERVDNKKKATQPAPAPKTEPKPLSAREKRLEEIRSKKEWEEFNKNTPGWDKNKLAQLEAEEK